METGGASTRIRLTHPTITASCVAAASRLVEVRQYAVTQLSAGKAPVAETALTSANGQVETRVIGEDVPNKVRSAFVIRGTSKKTVTVALTRYMLEEVGGPFAVYAGLIFDLLVIKDL